MPSNSALTLAIATIEATGLPCPVDALVMVRTWGEILADLSDDDIQGGVVGWLRSPGARYGRWPDPGSILEHVPRRQIAAGSTTMDGRTAWGLVRVELERFNPYAPHRPEWPAGLEERFNRVVQGMGGLAHLAQQDYAALEWTGKAFAEQWRALDEGQAQADRAGQVLSLADGRSAKAIRDRAGGMHRLGDGGTR